MSDHDEWRDAVSHLTEFERAVNCSHTRQTTQQYCPDCGHDIQAEL